MMTRRYFGFLFGVFTCSGFISMLCLHEMEGDVDS
jgi:hypothetical protein